MKGDSALQDHPFFIHCSMNFSVTILGSGAAIPMTNRNTTAQLINVHEKYMLFDCAEGTQLQIRRNRLRLQKINHIFISHLHGDHYYGLMGLLTTLHLLGRETTMHVYAHPLLEEIITLHLNASNTILRYELIFHAIDPEKAYVILEEKNFTVSTIPMKHNFPCCGFLVSERQPLPNIRKDFLVGKELSNADFRKIKVGEDYTDVSGEVYKNEDITTPPKAARSYAFCADTAYDEAIIPIIENVDLLYHEATFMEERVKDAEEKFHSTAKQAATIAKKAKVEKLLLGHFSARYRDLDELLAEAKEVFPESYLAEDGMTFTI